MKALKKRSLAIALTLVMAVSLIPAAALAANADDFLGAAFLWDEDNAGLVGFTLKFKGVQEDIAAGDITGLSVKFQNAVEIEVTLQADIEKDAAPKGEDGAVLEETHFSLLFTEPFAEVGTYALSGKFKDKDFSAEAEITAADPEPVEEPTAWAKEGVDSLKATGVIPAELLSAYTSGIRRDEFTALMWNVYVYAKGDIEVPAETKFNDIADSKYKDQILKASSVSIIAGRGEGFDPAGELNRQEMAIIINNLVKAVEGVEIPEDVKVTAFTDNAEIASWAVFHVAYCADKGFMAGIGNNMFAPQRVLTRETALVGVNNVIGKFPAWGAGDDAAE